MKFDCSVQSWYLLQYCNIRHQNTTLGPWGNKCDRTHDSRQRSSPSPMTAQQQRRIGLPAQRGCNVENARGNLRHQETRAWERDSVETRLVAHKIFSKLGRKRRPSGKHSAVPIPKAAWLPPGFSTLVDDDRWTTPQPGLPRRSNTSECPEFCQEFRRECGDREINWRWTRLRLAAEGEPRNGQRHGMANVETIMCCCRTKSLNL